MKDGVIPVVGRRIDLRSVDAVLLRIDNGESRGELIGFSCLSTPALRPMRAHRGSPIRRTYTCSTSGPPGTESRLAAPVRAIHGSVHLVLDGRDLAISRGDRVADLLGSLDKAA
jgi:hypothetical protein